MSNTYVMDGVNYVEAHRRAVVGEKVLVTENFPFGSIGEVHTVTSVNHFNGGYVTDKAPLMNFERCVVLEPVESPQDITDLLANLARRVSSLERQLADTQSNVEKLAEELANVKHNEKLTHNHVVALAEQLQPQSAEVVTFEKFLDSIADKVAQKLVGCDCE
jgi:septal ring factor EnvC (AmiA/AmiB activator)